MTHRVPSRSMSLADGRAYAARWKLVADAERVELRSTPMHQKLAQLEAMMASARALGWATTDPAEVDEVRRRWNRLYALYRRA